MNADLDFSLTNKLVLSAKLGCLRGLESARYYHLYGHPQYPLVHVNYTTLHYTSIHYDVDTTQQYIAQAKMRNVLPNKKS